LNTKLNDKLIEFDGHVNGFRCKLVGYQYDSAIRISVSQFHKLQEQLLALVGDESDPEILMGGA
jgi:hypothetical protein